jgi:hypothetical protein
MWDIILQVLQMILKVIGGIFPNLANLFNFFTF